MTLSETFRDYIESTPEFATSKGILERNTEGSVWLMGGTVYRTLNRILHGQPSPEVDLDFLADQVKEHIVVPKGWTVSQNRYGNPKLVGPFEIDLVPLSTVRYITKNTLEPTIESFLDGTPLNVQAIVYNILTEKLQVAKV